jgi:hypothetical protein
MKEKLLIGLLCMVAFFDLTQIIAYVFFPQSIVAKSLRTLIESI